MISYSTEILYHFSCDSCKKWWSVGDHQISNARIHGETMTCPHCGTVGLLKENQTYLPQVEIKAFLEGNAQ